jgi:L-methionine (R)-S-oxide reductase
MIGALLTGYQVVAIIDIDCAELNGFDEVDQKHIEIFAELLAGGSDF